MTEFFERFVKIAQEETFSCLFPEQSLLNVWEHCSQQFEVLLSSIISNEVNPWEKNWKSFQKRKEGQNATF